MKWEKLFLFDQQSEKRTNNLLSLSLTMSTYIPVSQIDATKLSVPKEPLEIISKKSGEKFTRTYFQYNYGTAERPQCSEPLFELQICKGNIRKNEKGEIKLNLFITNQEDLAGLNQLNLGFALCIDKYKGRYGIRNFNPQNPGDLRGAVFYSQDKEGNVIAGSTPIMSLKLNEKSRFKVIKPKLNAEKQPVLLADGTPDFEEEVVNVNTLLGKQVDCSVVFNPRDLYHTRGLPIPQLYVRSCMILRITDSGDVEHGKSEMVKQFLQQNPDMLNTLAEQIAKLKLDQTSLLEVAKPKDTASSPPSNPVTLPQAPSQSNIQFAPQLQGQSQTQQAGIDLNSFLASQQQGLGQVTLTKL
jgi:hypothetical protein